MSKNPWEYALRNPRHQATGPEGHEIRIERAGGRDPLVTSARLIDFSRNGFRLRTPFPLEIGEPLTMQLHDERSSTDLTLFGVVRWCRPDENESWLLGCQTAREADWETLGELFVNEILASDE